jgi:hypothetical protein
VDSADVRGRRAGGSPVDGVYSRLVLRSCGSVSFRQSLTTLGCRGPVHRAAQDSGVSIFSSVVLLCRFLLNHFPKDRCQ